MDDLHEINMDCFNNPELIKNQLNWQDLVKLTCIAASAAQLDQIAQAKNINAQVVTAIIANAQAKLYEMSPDSLLILAKLSRNVDELCKIVMVANVWR